MEFIIHPPKILLIFTIGFALAGLLGYFSQKCKLSPLLGYLLAGYFIGPYFPGIIVDVKIAEQLAEIGVILMLFGVGLHFQWEELLRVKKIAIPGAVLQTVFSCLIGTLLCIWLGQTVESSLIIGLSISIASTVVLIKVLSETHLVKSRHGHIFVGWLIVEDLITVFVLLLLPIISRIFNGEDISFGAEAGEIFLTILKFLILAILMMTFGVKIVSYLLGKISATESHELFTISLLAIIFLVALGSTALFGTSIALGAFISGMLIGKTESRSRAAANALPLSNAFMAIFFLSVGMLFNPLAIVNNFPLFIIILSLIMLLKPLLAFLIERSLGHGFKLSLRAAVILAQIGEFSFILCEEALRYKMIPDEVYDVIVACAFISISLNPLLFRMTEKYLHPDCNF